MLQASRIRSETILYSVVRCSVKEGVLTHFSFYSWKRPPRSYLGGGSSMLKKGDKAYFFIRVAGGASEGPNTVAIVVWFWDSRASARGVKYGRKGNMVG
jgi:hypothetical protein